MGVQANQSSTTRLTPADVVAAREVITDYSDPLVMKTADLWGTITSTIDLTGRVVSYVDVLTSEEVTPPAGWPDCRQGNESAVQRRSAGHEITAAGTFG